MKHGEFLDPRLVELYDLLCLWSRDDEFFLAVVNERPRSRVADVGCGTGRFTLALVAAGHEVAGVDPAGASLARARGKPGADQATWVEGTAGVLPTAAFDTVTVTAHLA